MTGPSSQDDDVMPDAEKTQAVPAPSPSALVHENAGRLLAGMLDSAPDNQEHGGDTIGPYRLCEIIGEGGFGNVWRAEQTEVVTREVALKVVKLGMDTAQVLGRFNQERQALAALEHPNIATLLDAGVGPNGRPYFAMELVRGGSITHWCRERAVALPERLRLFIQVCQAVQHAHEKGILHRDIKPSNVLVTEVDGAPVPKVIDFGIAKAMSGSQAELSLLTQTGQVIGTPLYMSPEQVEGGELDARSDVHALGTLLYELLTGMAPFSPDSAGKANADDIRKAILETNPERPNTRLRRQRKLTTQDRSKTHAAERLASLPKDLDWITMRALEKCRERRYASAAELAADVQRHLDSLPVLARPPSLTYAAGRWLRRHRRRCVAGAAVVLSSLAAAALSMRWAKEPEIPFPDPLPPAEVARRSVTNSLGMKFVPVPGIDALFCIHETRRQDYAAYAAAVPGVNTLWQDIYQTSPTLSKAGLGPKDDQPVIMVNWEDANGFCQWLSRVEGRTYRLPTDAEWSAAAGLRENHDQGVSPSKLSSNPERTQFPWGTHFPPRANDLTDNYADDAWARAFPDRPSIPGYNDGFPTIAPVMSFKPNLYGLYDMSGNVQETCSNWMDGHRRSRVSRGGSFHHYETSYLRLTERFGIAAPPGRFVYLGFRCVLDVKASSPATPASKPAAAVPAARPLTNSLGMKFIPVPITGGRLVHFSVWETRVQDYETFIKETRRERGHFSNQLEQGPAHPVVNVSWNDAKAFCTWLTDREQKAFNLRRELTYRLPTDHEWSCAVGIGGQEDATKTPAEKDGKMPGVYPWGTAWPPPDNAVNGSSAEIEQLEQGRRLIQDKGILRNRHDGHAFTAPVGSFPANHLGLHDLAGNVWEWCEDWKEENVSRVWRGGSWLDWLPYMLNPSSRQSRTPAAREIHGGFRVVLAPSASPATTVSSPALPSQESPPARPRSSGSELPQAGQGENIAANPNHSAATKDAHFVNSLGMKFVPVPGTKVLFCIHETRRQDYAAFAATRPGLSTSWQNADRAGVPAGHLPDHPVVMVSWNDANTFCEWLSQRESRTYRLPTDREWSIAVGLGKEDEPAGDLSPEALGMLNIVSFPWGGPFPPRTADRAGNYADTVCHETFDDRPWIADYTDGYATTSPVMSFKPNALGLFDMGGNVTEWCLELYSPGRQDRVTRGGSYHLSSFNMMRSSHRGYGREGQPSNGSGFRVVLEAKAAPPKLPE